jgi:hypothetical protein
MEGSFWPIAHRIKERQSLNRNHGSGCNKMSDIQLEVPAPVEFEFTAGVQRVPTPVEFMVMACHATRGSGSFDINIAEERPLRVEEFGVTAISELKAHSPVEFTVTACHAMRGSGSSEINIDKKDALPMEQFGVTAFHQNRGGKRGFQHLPKSTKTNSSLRIFAAHKGTIKYGAPQNFFLKKTWSKKAHQNNQLTSC